MDYCDTKNCVMSEDLSLDLLSIDENIHRAFIQMILNHSTSQLDAQLNQVRDPIQYLTLVKKYDQH